MRLDKLASPGAIEFIAATAPAALTSSTAGATAIAAVAIASAAVLFFYNLYEHFEAKKHAKEIAYIEELHQEDLAKIAIHECNIIAGFPPIFQKDGDGQYKTMAMTDAQVISIGSEALRTPTDIDLVTYRHHIIRAIEALKKYYFLHNEKTGITVQVILYLLNILEKLLQFQGYAFDIAYLNGLCNFICKYASSKGEKSEHFSCLNHVFRHLQYAMQKLIQHKETRSQEEMIAELRGTCMLYIDRSIRALAKFSISHEEWHDIDCCDPYLLKDKIYATTYVKRYGPAYWTHEQKLLPNDSPLTDVICRLTTYYLETLNPTKQPAIPLQQNIMIHQLPESVLAHIHAVFEADTEKHPAKPIRHIETQQIIQTFSQFSTLIHAMISFLYFLNELTKMIKSLGTSETDNPAHCKRIYALHEILSGKIEVQAEMVEKAFLEINRKNNNQMRIATKECFLRDLMKMMNEIKLTINNQSDAIRERRKALNKKEMTNVPDETPREHMSVVMHQIQAACNIAIISPHTTSVSSTSHSVQYLRIPAVPRTRPTMTPTAISSNSPPSAIESNRDRQLEPRHSDAPLTPHNTVNNQPTQNVTAMRNTITFPKSYDKIYDAAKIKSAHQNLQLLHLMIDMMNDYTKNNSRALRVIHGSFFHHHVEEAAEFSNNLIKKIGALTNNMDSQTSGLLLAQLQILTTLSEQQSTKREGSFAMRVAFITEKCREKGHSLPAALPRLATI